MHRNAVRLALFVFTVAYGPVIALLAILDVSALGIFAAAGAVLICAGWASSSTMACEKARH